MSWKDAFKREKQIRGMAPVGSILYDRNAAHILKHCPDREDTRAKMENLSCSRDSETAAVAQQWLCEHSNDYE